MHAKRKRSESAFFWESIGSDLICCCFLQLLHLHCTNLQRQTEQGDESVCIVVIVEIAGGEGSKRLIVQAVRRRLAGFDDVAFEQFEFYFACYVFWVTSTNAWIASRRGVYHFPS